MSRLDAGQTHYQVLGLDPSCTADDIRKAYRKIALKNHPDRGGSGNVEVFKRAVEAYEVLGDATKRNTYDLSLNPPPRTRFQSAPSFDTSGFADIFDTAAYFGFTSAYTGRPKRRPASAASSFGFGSFDFFSFDESPFEFMPWTRRPGSSFRSAPGSTFSSRRESKTPRSEFPEETTFPSSKRYSSRRHFSEAKSSVRESYVRAQKSEFPQPDSSEFRSSEQPSQSQQPPPPPPPPPPPAESPVSPESERSPGITIDPKIIDLTQEDDPEGPEPVAEPELSSPKRQRSNDGGLPKAKKTKIDIDLNKMAQVPPFTQTNGNFNMAGMSSSIPKVDSRPRQYNAPKRDDFANLGSSATLDQVLRGAEQVTNTLMDNFDYCEGLFKGVGTSAGKIKAQVPEMIMDSRKVDTLLEGTKADISQMRQWLEKMESQQKMLESWKDVLSRLN